MKDTFSCPKCGALNLTINDLAGADKNLCPYCGHELIDLSIKKHQDDVADVLTREKRLRKIPLKVSLTIGITIFLLFLVSIIIIVTRLDTKAGNAIASSGSNYYTSQMEKAYEKEDWDKLYDILITNCDKSINSPWYFTYRTAWYLHTFPASFDDAVAEKDKKRAKEIYSIIREDYLLRDEFFDTYYESLPGINEQLTAEFEREDAIMKDFDNK